MQALREAAITCANNRNTVEDCTLYTVLTLAYSCRSCICVHDGGGTAWTPPPASFPSLLPTPFRAFDLERKRHSRGRPAAPLGAALVAEAEAEAPVANVAVPQDAASEPCREEAAATCGPRSTTT